MISLAAACLLLSGCSGGKFVEEVEKTEVKNNEVEKEKKAKKAYDEKEQKEMYEKLEKPMDEVIMENDLDSVTIMDSIEFTKQDQYQDGREFAKFAAQVLYQFYTLQITSEQYYEFLKDYGSERVLKELPTEEDAITILSTLQGMYKKQNIAGENYVLTEVSYDRLKKDGSFYRKVLTTNGMEYFFTIIVKEKDVWKYEEDSPSPPFIESKTQETTSN